MLGGSLSARRAWIEITRSNRNRLTLPWSLSARRAWIEILTSVVSSAGTIGVALRKESVDRNIHAVQIVIIIMVALRKESVDRNNR